MKTKETNSCKMKNSGSSGVKQLERKRNKITENRSFVWIIPSISVRRRAHPKTRTTLQGQRLHNVSEVTTYSNVVKDKRHKIAKIFNRWYKISR